MRNVERKSFFYELLRLYAMLIKKLSHRYVTVTGIENVPKGVPVILAPNHQNALYDSLSIVLNSFLKPVFLARADLFKKKFNQRFFNFFGMAPVYRIRDGKDTLDKNVAVFDNCVRILKNNRMLCIYPEAAHIGMKSMMPHKKAIPRIVFLAAQNTNYDIDVKIIPIGINYSHYYNFRRSFTINFGKPISSKDYYELLKKEGESKATNVLRKDLFDAIERLAVHVPEKKYYDLYEQAFELMKPVAYKKLGLKNSIKYFYKAEKYIERTITSSLSTDNDLKEKWNAKAVDYKKLKEELNLDETVLFKGGIKLLEIIRVLLISVCLIPVGIYGLVSTGWFFAISNFMFRSKFKDKQFYSTVAFAITFIFYPFWLLAHFFIVYAIADSWIIALSLVLFSLPSGIVAWEVFQLLRRTIKRLRINEMIGSRNQSFRELLTIRKELKTFYSSIIN